MGRLLALGSVLGLAAASGGYFPQSWGWAAIALAWAAAVGLVVAPARPSRLELAFLGGLVLLAGWTALSAVWSQSVPSTALEVERDLVYVAGVGAGLVLLRRDAVDGVLAACVVVSAWNLVVRIHGYDPTVPGADAAPIGYANGLGLLAAIGVLLACRRLRTLPALLVLVPVLVLSGSDGSWLAVACGALVALSPRLAPLAALVAVAAVLAGLHAHERAAYWDVALADAGAHPALGSGAGTWGAQWIERRSVPLDAVDAHSLELETLAELGVVGLLILGGTLVVPLLGGRGGAALGAYAAWVVQSGIDWEWELPAVTLAGLLCGVAALRAERPRDTVSRAWRAGGVATGLAVAGLALVGLVGNRALDAAAAARQRGDARTALAEARTAERWAPWASEPLRIEAAATGDPELLRRAVAKDPRNWALWAALRDATRGPERRRAAEEAPRLNPLGANAPSG